MNSIENTRYWKKAALDLKASVFNAGKIVLNVDGGFTFNPNTSTFGDLSEPSDGGYTPGGQTPTYGAAINYGADDAQIVAALMTWNFTFSAGAFTIYHVCQLDGAGNLLWVFALDAPVSVAGPGPWQFIPAYVDGDY